MVSAMALANTFIEKAQKENRVITPMKLQRLIYLTYEEYAQRTGQALFKEEFEVHGAGPIIRSVYNEFVSQEKEITRFGKNADGKIYMLSKENNRLNEIVNSVWKRYRGYYNVELSNLVKKPGSPWFIAKRRRQQTIKFEDIKRG